MTELLTQEEGERAVNEWLNEDWATRFISLGRGHWEDIVPIIAKAQLAKSQECPECKGRGLVKIVTQTDPPDTWLDDCPTCHGTDKAKPDSPELREILETTRVEWDGGLILIDDFEDLYQKILDLWRNEKITKR